MFEENAPQRSRLVLCLERLTELVKEPYYDGDDLDVFSDRLNHMLEELLEDGQLGQEGERDPRGPQNQGTYSVYYVHEYDD